MNYRERMEEYEYNLRDLCFHILLKWRQILVAFVVVGTLFGVFSGVKSFIDVKNAEAALAEQNIQENEETIIVPELKIINPGSIIAGGVLGAFIAVMLPFCSYIFSTKMRYEDDLTTVFGLHSIVSCTDRKKKCKNDSFIDTWLYDIFWKNEHRFTVSEQINVAVTDCVITMAQNGYKNVCFISSLSEGLQLMHEIGETLSKIVDICILEKPILSSAKSLQTIQKYDCVIIVEKTNESFYEDILKELEYCDRFHVPVLGGIVCG